MASVTMRAEPHSDKMWVKWAYSMMIKTKDNGEITVWIPFFDIYYSAKSEEAADKKGRIMMKMFFDHFFLHHEKNSLKNFALHMHKIGFKADRDNIVLHEMVRNKFTPAKFKAAELIDMPTEFLGAEQREAESEMAVCV